MQQLIVQHPALFALYLFGAGAAFAASVIYERFAPTPGATAAHVIFVSGLFAVLWPVLALGFAGLKVALELGKILGFVKM